MSDTPTERPVKRRSGARVIVVAGREVLLQGDTDPGLPGSRFWQVPGGGIDPGESAGQAAARELAEETGYGITRVRGLLERAGTTFRKLDDASKADLDQAKAVELMHAQPSMIKRPVLDTGSQLIVGFTPDNYAEQLK